MAREQDLQNLGEMVLGMVDGLMASSVLEASAIRERNVEKRLFDFCDEKELCEANTWFKRGNRGKYHTVWVKMKL